jgi:hypothetical protein
VQPSLSLLCPSRDAGISLIGMQLPQKLRCKRICAAEETFTEQPSNKPGLLDLGGICTKQSKWNRPHRPVFGVILSRTCNYCFHYLQGLARSICAQSALLGDRPSRIAWWPTASTKFSWDELRESAVNDLYAPSSHVERARMAHNSRRQRSGKYSANSSESMLELMRSWAKVFVDSCLNALPSSVAYLDGHSQRSSQPSALGCCNQR